MKILWLKTELLHPVDKGGKIRTYEMLKQLKKDHFITYLTLCDPVNDSPEAFLLSKEYCHRLVTVSHHAPQKFSAGFFYEVGLNLGSRLPYALQRYRSTAMLRAIDKELRQKDYDVLVCDFLAPSINLPRHIQIPTVLFQHNVESIIWLRHFQNATNKLKKAHFYSQWRRMHNYERQACRRFDSVVAVSEVDRKIMQEKYGVERVYDIPTGVDTDFFKPLHTKAVPHQLVFTGSMDWLPNEDAICYFAEQILPLVASQIPEVTLKVVGRNPTPRLVALAQSNSQITVTGRVNDVRPYIDSAAVYIVPIRIGGGTRLKIYEAMAMEKAIVSTTIGAEGLSVQHGNDLLLADTPADFASAIVRVLSDQTYAHQLSTKAATTVRENFGWNKVAQKFTEVCESVQHPSSVSLQRPTEVNFSQAV